MNHSSLNWEERWSGGDTPWDKGIAAPPLSDFIKSNKISGKILVPGCGAGHEVGLLAQENSELVGVDISSTAIDRAQGNYPKINAIWRQADFFEEGLFEEHSFDWIVEHTFFCAIDPQLRTLYAERIQRYLKPSGFFFAIFFKNPDSESGPPYLVTNEEIETLFGKLKLIDSWIPSQTFPGRERREEVRVYQKPVP